MPDTSLGGATTRSNLSQIANVTMGKIGVGQACSLWAAQIGPAEAQTITGRRAAGGTRALGRTGGPLCADGN